MKRIAAGIFVVAMCIGQTVMSTVGWPEINATTIQGNWVCLDHVTGDVFRMKIDGQAMLLAITSGPRGVEFLFRSSTFLLKKGKISAAMKEQSAEAPSVRMEATGVASDDKGRLTVTLLDPQGFYASWVDATLSFVKEGRESIVERLRSSDSRARALIQSVPGSNSKVMQ